jgi:hypothetical protein
MEANGARSSTVVRFDEPPPTCARSRRRTSIYHLEIACHPRVDRIDDPDGLQEAADEAHAVPEVARPFASTIG